MHLKVLKQRALTAGGLVPSWVIWVNGVGKRTFDREDLLRSFLRGLGVPADRIEQVVEPFHDFLEFHFTDTLEINANP